MAKPGGIYVETFVRASRARLIDATQRPEVHQRWDLRFTDITYLPREDGADQRFTYATRIGFGLAVRGMGQTTGSVLQPDGTFVSGLRFWSDDPKSLIRTGSGYWRYVPQDGGMRFLTYYDYQTRFGVVGASFDRIAFRPLLGWATAWSFDRLRLWLERGIEPERARSAALARAGFVAAALAALGGVCGRRGRRLALGVAAAAVLAAYAVGDADTPAARRCMRAARGT